MTKRCGFRLGLATDGISKKLDHVCLYTHRTRVARQQDNSSLLVTKSEKHSLFTTGKPNPDTT